MVDYGYKYDFSIDFIVFIRYYCSLESGKRDAIRNTMTWFIFEPRVQLQSTKCTFPMEYQQFFTKKIFFKSNSITFIQKPIYLFCRYRAKIHIENCARMQIFEYVYLQPLLEIYQQVFLFLYKRID